MSSTFDGATIRVELNAADASTPWWERETFVTSRHIPGGDDDVIQVMGIGYGAMTVRMDLDAGDEWNAFAAKLGTEGDLVIADVDYGTCLLQAISGVTRMIGGRMQFSATFKKTAAGA